MYETGGIFLCSMYAVNLGKAEELLIWADSGTGGSVKAILLCIKMHDKIKLIKRSKISDWPLQTILRLFLIRGPSLDDVL